MAAGALAYDTIPLSSASRLDPFSPQFQSMTLEKGAMIFHMLRWRSRRQGLSRPSSKARSANIPTSSIRTEDFEKVSEAQSQQQLLPFFAQWVDGTGAPNFTDKYAVYRLGNNKGFRTIGEINQDLDLFRMPVELRIETDGKTENQKIDVVGTDTQYVVDTFGRPRRISVDPGDWVLKTTPDLQVRIAILKGQQLVAQGDLVNALAEYKKALDSNPLSSLASYRIGEVLFTQRNYQAASTPSATLFAATTSRPGPKSGATSPSARSSTSPASATAPSTSTAWPSRPTTTPRAQSTKPASICKSPTSGLKRTRSCFFSGLNQDGQLI